MKRLNTSRSCCTGLTLLSILLIHVIGISTATAQSGTRNTARTKSFEESLWIWLKDSKYENWAPVPKQNGDFYPGKDPHGDFRKIYVNRLAYTSINNPQLGSVLVAESYDKTKRTITGITVMYRNKGYHPVHNDWYWVQYNPDGSVAIQNNHLLHGKVLSCINCHRKAGGEDYVFGND